MDIVRENLLAVQTIYFSYQLEEVRLYQVVDRVAELFHQGLLPIRQGKVTDRLKKYAQKASVRINASARQDLYSCHFGAAGGKPTISEPDRDFNDLWLRLLSAVTNFAQKSPVKVVLRDHSHISVLSEQVRKAAHDLASNLSRNGSGVSHSAAVEMQQSIAEICDCLSDPELLDAFGARDMWQVIDIVNTNHLGGARNTHRFQTLSHSGSVIIRWIANNAKRLSNDTGAAFAFCKNLNPNLSVSVRHKPTVDPTDWDLVKACEQWLSVDGVPDKGVEQIAQRIDSPIAVTNLTH